MTEKIAKRFVIGEIVYRVSGINNWPDTILDLDPQQCSPCFVKKLMDKAVFVHMWMTYALDYNPYQGTFTLSRRDLERRGWTGSNIRGTEGVYLTFMPDKFRKKTIDYLLDREPLKTLGFEQGYKPTEDELKTAFRRRAMETHPDRKDGREDDFRKVHKTYEELKKGGAFARPFGVMHKQLNHEMCFNCMSTDYHKVSEGVYHCYQCGSFETIEKSDLIESQSLSTSQQ